MTPQNIHSEAVEVEIFGEALPVIPLEELINRKHIA